MNTVCSATHVAVVACRSHTTLYTSQRRKAGEQRDRRVVGDASGAIAGAGTMFNWQSCHK